MTALRVMQVITRGDAGGAQTHLLTLCEGLRNRVELCVVIGSGLERNVLAEGVRSLGVETLDLPQLRNSISPLQLLRAVRALVALVQARRPDLLHVHSSFAGAVARVAGHICKVPVIYTVHGFGFKPQARPIVRHCAWLGEAALARWTAHMISVSRHEATLAARLPIPPGATSVIHNGLTDVPWRAQPADEPVSVAMVARLAAPKRVDLLLEALAGCPAPPPAVILGDGPDRTALVERARQLGLTGVVFAGTVNDVPQQLARHGIFVLLSDHEGLPISVIEAMRAGMAIIASRLPGIEELLVDEVSALLVPNDVDAVRGAIVRLQGDAELRQRLARAARERYEGEFSAAEMCERVLAVYRQTAPIAEAAH